MIISPNKKFCIRLVAAATILSGGGCLLSGQSLSTYTDTFDPELPGSAYGWVVRATHLETPGEVVDFDQMQASDWIVPNNLSAFGPGVFDRMLTDTPRIQALEPSGFGSSGAHHQYDAYIVPIVYSNGELTGQSDVNGYWATSWIGDDAGGNATWEFRVAVDADTLEVWHWWNHGLGNYQLVTATLYNSAGDELVKETVMEHSTTIFRQYTTIINVTGSAAGDYMLIEHQGTNVGWRGSAVIASSTGPVEPEFGPFTDYPRESGFADTGDWLGHVFIEGTYPYVYIANLRTWAFASSAWLYLFSTDNFSMTEVSPGGSGWVHLPAVASFAYKSGDWFFVLP